MNLVFCLNKKFLDYTCCCIKSIIHNNKNFINKIYILSEDLTQDDLKNKDIFNVIPVEIRKPIYPPDFKFEKLNSSISRESYFRLFIPETLKNIDKCLYMDGDMFCFGDIKTLDYYPCDYLCGVSGFNNPITSNACDRYINAGLIIMNLKAMREDNFLDKARQIHSYDNPYWLHDQTIINLGFNSKIELIPEKFNCMIVDFNNLEKFIRSNDIRVIHLASRFKWFLDKYALNNEFYLDNGNFDFCKFQSMYTFKTNNNPIIKPFNYKDIKLNPNKKWQDQK